MPNWSGPYPGCGPWRHLPPPMRPGWQFRGRGWCWWWTYPWMSKEDEIKYLEDLKKYVTDVMLKEIDARLKELKEGKS